MAAFVAGDITYALLNQRKMSDSRNMNRVRLTFGAGAETYATGGIPLTIGKLGCPTVVESLIVVDKGDSGYSFMYDQSAKKIIVFVAPAQTHTHDVKVIASITEDSTIGLQGQVFGKNSATNATIVGANSATNGGVVSATLAAAALSELANGTDIATQVLEVEVIGY
jgi:hypothetical protein